MRGLVPPCCPSSPTPATPPTPVPVPTPQGRGLRRRKEAMPSKPKKPCSQPGCPELVTTSKCAEHSKQARKARTVTGTKSSKPSGYGADWPTIRGRFLYRNAWCVLCGAPSTVADHHPLTFKALKAQGVADPHSDHRLRALCSRCHNQHTANTTPGGWASEKQQPEANWDRRPRLR